MKPRTKTDNPLYQPNALEIMPRSVRGTDWRAASFAIVGYPREVGAGWLEPLLTFPGRLDVSLHIEPIPQQIAAGQLKRQLARLESVSRSDASHGRLTDFENEAAADDAHELAASLARGYGRLFQVGLYLTVHAHDDAELDAEVQRVHALASSLLLDAAPTTFRALQGWTTTLPLATDALGQRRTFDTQALAASFPFTSPELAAPDGESTVLYGLNAASGGVVLWDRYAQDNYNSVVIARSGAGKSYFTKLETLRLLYHGVEVAIIDPEDEYARLAGAAGGTCLKLGAGGVRWNPFDLPGGEDALSRRSLFLQTLVATMLGEPQPPAARARLDAAILATYAAKGITHDPSTWNRSAPLLADLVERLGEDELAVRLAPYVTGSYKGLFDGPTTTQPHGHLIVFCLRELPEELKPVGTLLALDAIWRRVSNPRDRRKRLVVVDEAWLLMKQPEGARFLYRLAKSARKYWTGLAVVTQDAADLLGSDLGKAVISNAASQVLFRQAPQAIDAVGDAFDLTDGERHYLLAAEKGDGLVLAGAASSRVALHTLASDTEHSLITTDPAEIAQLATTTGHQQETGPYDEDEGDPL